MNKTTTIDPTNLPYPLSMNSTQYLSTMMKMLPLFVLISVVLPAAAQSDNNERCGFKRIEDTDQFEHWLNVRQASSAGLSNKTYRVPVVVHVIHAGESVGEGFNYSSERIESQIRTLNEDFRRKEGSPGFNSHPDGEDTQIEFVLAQIDPQGNPTNGIVRVDQNSIHPPTGIGDFITLCSKYSYWNPEKYLNVWCWDIGLHGIYAGKSRFPVSDLEGLPTPDQEAEGDGIFINAINFGQGETNTLPNLDMGRTLTHEMGHFLGLLHTFGPLNNCDYSDYCDDTPPTRSATNGCPAEKSMACDGRPAMIENYMDYAYDRCMNIFTKDQTARMRTVLENSPRRKSLLTSDVITDVEDDVTHGVILYPNPAKDKLYISVSEKFLGDDINVTAYTLLGQTIFNKTFKLTATDLEIPVSAVSGEFIILLIDGKRLFYRRLILID